MIGALFRLMEIEGGAIMIDGVDTRSVPLRRLRGAMALIPQVRVIASFSVRFFCVCVCVYVLVK